MRSSPRGPRSVQQLRGWLTSQGADLSLLRIANVSDGPTEAEAAAARGAPGGHGWPWWLVVVSGWLVLLEGPRFKGTAGCTVDSP